MSSEDPMRRLILREEFQRKVREEEIKWRQRLSCKWLKEGDKNMKFCHGLAYARKRKNRILTTMDGEKRLEGKDESNKHTEDHFSSLYSQEVKERPSLDNMDSPRLNTEEIRKAIYDLGAQMGFPWPSSEVLGNYERRCYFFYE